MRKHLTVIHKMTKVSVDDLIEERASFISVTSIIRVLDVNSNRRPKRERCGGKFETLFEMKEEFYLNF